MADFQALLDEVAAGIPEMDARLTPGLFRPGTEVAVSSSLVQDLLAAIEAEGLEGRVGPMTAWVDAAFLNEAGIPAVCFGPGSITNAHAAVEWVAVDEVEAGARILTRFAGRFLKGI
jgi:acetylornithine deacetylase